MYMRALDQEYRGKGSNNTYVEANAPVRGFGCRMCASVVALTLYLLLTHSLLRARCTATSTCTTI